MEETWQQRLWRELHERASRPSAPVPATETQWLREFDRRIHCQNCRAHWRGVVRQHPPVFSARRAYFLWTVRAHNAINLRLGKPIFPFQEACRRWRYLPSYS